ncbi:hypothetical protein [Bailinhaonella thermotolerans]|uniref:Uncharacterized protein n=1 Tax=Bailinhaonella thermotolerans TaxID=1070861 RepID=A0A3A4A392_9ACTN|nr:hypothetical protein [Bailinhaonella thermotolerans]RJL21234.1 hypothetical protein D5H75_37850 [Bailinhaonella thermotolerans]
MSVETDLDSGSKRTKSRRRGGFKAFETNQAAQEAPLPPPDVLRPSVPATPPPPAADEKPEPDDSSTLDGTPKPGEAPLTPPAAVDSPVTAAEPAAAASASVRVAVPSPAAEPAGPAGTGPVSPGDAPEPAAAAPNGDGAGPGRTGAAAPTAAPAAEPATAASSGDSAAAARRRRPAPTEQAADTPAADTPSAAPEPPPAAGPGAETASDPADHGPQRPAAGNGQGITTAGSWAASEPIPTVPVAPVQPVMPPPRALVDPPAAPPLGQAIAEAGTVDIRVPVPMVMGAGTLEGLTAPVSGKRKKVIPVYQQVAQQLRETLAAHATPYLQLADCLYNDSLLEVLFGVPAGQEQKIAEIAHLHACQALGTTAVEWRMGEGALLLRARVALHETTQQVTIYLTVTLWEEVRRELEEQAISLTDLVIDAYNRFCDHPQMFWPNRKSRATREGRRRGGEETKPRTLQLTPSEQLDLEHLEMASFARNRSEFFDRLLRLEMDARRQERELG